MIDSRASREGATIRRRRQCTGCEHRFTTYEEIEREELMVVKRDGRRESFSREKLLSGLNQPIFADRKCLPKSRKSIAGLPDAIYFGEFCRNEFFNTYGNFTNHHKTGIVGVKAMLRQLTAP